MERAFRLHETPVEGSSGGRGRKSFRELSPWLMGLPGQGRLAPGPLSLGAGWQRLSRGRGRGRPGALPLEAVSQCTVLVSMVIRVRGRGRPRR